MSKKKEFTTSIIEAMKLPNDIFTYELIFDEVKNVADADLMKFYKLLFDERYKYLNGIAKVVAVAKEFNAPDTSTKDLKARAKKIIIFAEGFYETVFEHSIATGDDFNKLIQCAKPDKRYRQAIEILNLVKPHDDYKSFILNMKFYQTSLEVEKRVIEAIRAYDESKSIENVNLKQLGLVS
ncbi:MAG: hypothetical protein U9N42_05290 [Campylobacterota bacterium]|nr:hypothetical protein [Campylobacterota bacterium]